MLPTPSKTSSTASIYYDARDTFTTTAATPAVANASIFTRIKNKITSATNFCVATAYTKIHQRFIKIKDTISPYTDFISDKIDILLRSIKKITISIVNNVSKINLISVSINRNNINNYNITDAQ